jgi:hypothetical protein
MDESGDASGRRATSPDDAASASSEARRSHQAPSPCIEQARRYLDLLAGGDAPHCFQPYHDLNRNDPETGWMRRAVHGRLGEVWPKLVERQSKGAAIAVTMAETDGCGRKSANMIRARAVWIEADAALPRELPLAPTIAVETSPGHRHYVYVSRDLTWELWHGVQQVLIADYGSDRRAAHPTQVLRLPGTLHLKDPAHPHLVDIVEDLTSERIYTAAEIAAAFPPRPSTTRIRHRVAAARMLRAGHCVAPGADWDPANILAALRSIDARLLQTGPFIAQGDRPGDKPIPVDWSRRDWWLLATACLHHASGGSEDGFKLSCAASGGDSSLGLIGCPAKFDAADQRRVWDNLTAGAVAELRGAAVTIRTIYWIARRYCGWKTGRRGWPIGQPRPVAEIASQAQAVADAGRWAVSTGLARVLALHEAVASQRIPKDSLMGRILAEIRRAIDAGTGIAAIGSLTGMAGTLSCATETLRRYLRNLAEKDLIIKNEGNATSALGTSGITVALAFPPGFREAMQAQPSPATADPPISDQTGIAIPHFQTIPGRNPSRSPYSHDREGAAASRGQDALPDGREDPLWGKADLSLGDWIQAGVVHAEFGDHLERLADAHGKGGVSRVLTRLQELRVFRSSFADIRSDAERAADLAARSLARKAAKSQQLAEADMQRLLSQAVPAGIAAEDSAAFAREMARHLTAMIREAKGDPDPWRSARWRERSGRQGETARPNGNAYAAARMKRDPTALDQGGQDRSDEPPF